MVMFVDWHVKMREKRRKKRRRRKKKVCFFTVIDAVSKNWKHLADSFRFSLFLSHTQRKRRRKSTKDPKRKSIPATERIRIHGKLRLFLFLSIQTMASGSCKRMAVTFHHGRDTFTRQVSFQ
jgi:hypothetical protein